MSQQIIQQPDGKYALWSTVVDDFVLLDATPEEILRYWVEGHKADTAKRIADIIAKLQRGEKPYYQFTVTWERANTLREENHA